MRNACHLALALFGGFIGSVSADTLELHNGDRLHGTVIQHGSEVLTFKSSSFGQTLTVPLESIANVDQSVGAAEVMVEPIDDAEQEFHTEEQALDATETGESTPKLQLPENWNAQLSVGYADRDGQADSREVSAEGKLTWKQESNEAEWSGHYRYFEHETKKAADRYGLTQRLRHRGKNGFFLQSVTKGEVDNVTKNRTQFSQTAGLGYAPLKNEKLKVDIAPGFKAEYIADAEKESQEGAKYKANVRQDLSWQVSDQVAVGQGLSYSVDPRDDTNWDFDFSAFVETQVNDDVKMRLSYRRDFLNEVAGHDDKESAEMGASLVWDF